jgi:hypothetical protein
MPKQQAETNQGQPLGFDDSMLSGSKELDRRVHPKSSQIKPLLVHGEKRGVMPFSAPIESAKPNTLDSRVHPHGPNAGISRERGNEARTVQPFAAHSPSQKSGDGDRIASPERQ